MTTATTMVGRPHSKSHFQPQGDSIDDMHRKNLDGYCLSVLHREEYWDESALWKQVSDIPEFNNLTVTAHVVI